MEKKSIVLNQTTRPYLHNGKIIFRFSKWHPYPIFLQNSILFSFIDGKIQLLRYMLNDGYYTESATPGEYESSIKTTTAILKMIKNRVGDKVKLYSFNCRGPKEGGSKYDLFVDVTTQSGFVVIPNISQAVTDAEASGLVVRAGDGGHLNNLGNEILGKQLARYFGKVLAIH